MSDEHPAPVAIREAAPSDVPQIRALIEPFVVHKILLPRTNDELTRLVLHGFVAESEGRVVGFVALEVYSWKMAELQCLAVAADFQRRGLGKALVQRCMQRACELNIHELMAITASDALFRQCGFDYTLPDQKKALFVYPCTQPPRDGTT